MESVNINNLLPRLQRWYQSQCNGEWEHTCGIRIDTLDNPGWLLDVDLKSTDLEGRPFMPIEKGLNARPPSDDWLTCTVEDNHFKAFGGPLKLAELIAVFLNWTDEH